MADTLVDRMTDKDLPHELLLGRVWNYVGDKIGFQVLARRIRLLWQGSVSRLECLGRVFVGVAL